MSCAVRNACHIRQGCLLLQSHLKQLTAKPVAPWLMLVSLVDAPSSLGKLCFDCMPHAVSCYIHIHNTPIVSACMTPSRQLVRTRPTATGLMNAAWAQQGLTVTCSLADCNVEPVVPVRSVISQLRDRYQSQLATLMSLPMTHVVFDGLMHQPAPDQAYVPYQFTSTEQIGPRQMWFRFHTVNHSVLGQVQRLSTSAWAAALSAEVALIKSQVLLGEAIIVLDNIVADYVFGPYGSQGRPRGRLSITHIDSMATSHELQQDCLDRWKRITMLWARHDWTVSDIKTVGSALRDIRFQPAHRPDDVSDVSAVTIASYVPVCCHHL